MNRAELTFMIVMAYVTCVPSAIMVVGDCIFYGRFNFPDFVIALWTYFAADMAREVRRNLR